MSTVDIHWILAAQAGRAFGYGLAAVAARGGYAATRLPTMVFTHLPSNLLLAARCLTRPVGTALLGPVQLLTPGLPFLLAGAIKTGYDLSLRTWFRHIQLREPRHEPVPAGTPLAGNPSGGRS